MTFKVYTKDLGWEQELSMQLGIEKIMDIGRLAVAVLPQSGDNSCPYRRKRPQNRDAALSHKCLMNEKISTVFFI